ncbi:MAG: hypothetical protein WA994_00665 [Ornithinimicrobium sp.]
MPSSPPSASLVRVRTIANWLNVSTLLGLGLARAGHARIRPGPFGLYLADHYRWSFPAGGAFTVGDVVITRHDFDRMLPRRPYLLEHEEVHARQWMACLGLPFIPLYVASMGWSMLRTGDRAARCAFERHAGLVKGGYADVPVRPIGPALAQSGRRARAALTGR